MCQNFYFNKAGGLRPAILLKRGSGISVFLEFCEFFSEQLFQWNSSGGCFWFCHWHFQAIDLNLRKTAVFLPVSCLFWNVYLNFINVAILNVTACICLGNCHGDTCTHMGVLKKGKYLRSNNGIFKLILQENGNLEILCKTKPIWSTRTITNKVDFLYFKQNGKLV